MGRRRQLRRSDARRSDPRQLTGAAGVKIAVPKETVEGERRVAATPETVKKFIALGAEMAVERGAGASASIADADFEAAGATLGSRADVLQGADAVLAVQGPSPGDLGDIKPGALVVARSEEHTSELQSLMRISYAVFCLKKK